MWKGRGRQPGGPPVMSNRKALRVKVYWLQHGFKRTVADHKKLGYSEADIMQMVTIWKERQRGKGSDES
jgi:hypothetical protein